VRLRTETSTERERFTPKGQPTPRPPGATRNAAVGRLVNLQLQSTPERVDTLVDAWPAGPERDSALGNLVSNVSYKDPKQALDFARRIADTTQRDTAVERAARGWLSRDERAARAWLSSTQELTPGVKRVLLREFDQW
jgi:hypothetical protein